MKLVALACITSLTLLSPAFAQSEANEPTDRQAVVQTIENFYIGDHTGSTKHKKLSMHVDGAYRYVDKAGVYKESRFNVESNSSDQKYKEELLSVEIYENVALARLRLKQQSRDEAEYKLMTLHKTEAGWKITGISWGFGITQ